MKILVTAENQINVEVIKSDEEEVIQLGQIVAALEFAKQLVLSKWQQELNENV